MEVVWLRELIERTVRPGQQGGSLTVDRVPSAAMLQPQGHAGGNRYDQPSGEAVTYALYGRGRYGAGRYGSA